MNPMIPQPQNQGAMVGAGIPQVMTFDAGWVPFIQPCSDQIIALGVAGTKDTSFLLDAASEYFFWSARYASTNIDFPNIAGFRIAIAKGYNQYSLTGAKEVPGEIVFSTAQRPSFFAPQPWFVTCPGQVTLPMSITSTATATITIELYLVGMRRKLGG